jgi:hypothetical protein
MTPKKKYNLHNAPPAKSNPTLQFAMQGQNLFYLADIYKQQKQIQMLKRAVAVFVLLS